MTQLERTAEAQRGFDGMTTKVVVVDGADGLTPSMLRQPHQDPMHDDDPAPEKNGAAMDPFADDEPLACGLENPEVCESCQ